MAIAQFLVGLTVIMAFIAMVAALMFLHPTQDTSVVQLITTFGGQLSTLAALVVGYYFGSSATGKTKDDTINQMASTASTAGAALAAGTGNGSAAANGSTTPTVTTVTTRPAPPAGHTEPAPP